MRKNLFSILLVLSWNVLLAQDLIRCGTMERKYFFNPDFDALTNSSSKSASTQGENRKKIIVIPVVVHVLYQNEDQNIPDEQIEKQIGILNRDYRRTNQDANQTPEAFLPVAADCEIEFRLALRDPQGNPTNGITRTLTNIFAIGNTDKFYKTSEGGHDIWDRSSYLNIWVCQIKPNGDLLGFSPLPSFSPKADRDGVVIDYRYFGRSSNTHFNKGRTCTHEVGHWLDLYHIWGDDGGLCSGSDFVDDTPNQSTEHFGKPAFPSLDSCSMNYPGTMFMNYMDYSDDSEMNLFTKGQKLRMEEGLKISFRDSLKLSKGCVPLSPDENELFVYPNPSNGNFRIYIAFNMVDDLTVEVINLLGKQIFSTSYSSVQVSTEEISLQGYSAGVYLVKIEGGTIHKTIKLIKN